VLILTTFDLDEYVFAALRAGASGFMLKSISPGELLNAIQVVAAGDALLAPERDPPPGRGVSRAPPPLTPVAPGRRRRAGRDHRPGNVRCWPWWPAALSNTEIAKRLDITPATTKTHVGHLLTKLGARGGSRAPGHTGLPGGPGHPPRRRS